MPSRKINCRSQDHFDVDSDKKHVCSIDIAEKSSHCVSPPSYPLACLQPVSMIATLVYSRVFSIWGAHIAHGMVSVMMVLGFLAQLAIPKRYLRRDAEVALAKAKAGEQLGGADKPLLLEENKLAKA